MTTEGTRNGRVGSRAVIPLIHGSPTLVEIYVKADISQCFNPRPWSSLVVAGELVTKVMMWVAVSDKGSEDAASVRVDDRDNNR